MNEYFLKPGFICISDEEKSIKTVLGSCISVCLWDKVKKIGGMNHFIYPKFGKNDKTAKYGEISLPYLLKLMRQAGSKTENLIAHIIGGADSQSLSSKIGEKNIKLAVKFLEKSKVHIASRDVGGTVGKKVVFNTATGEVLVYKCMKVRESDWYK